MVDYELKGLQCLYYFDPKHVLGEQLDQRTFDVIISIEPTSEKSAEFRAYYTNGVPSCRCRGLFAGVELVKDRLKLTPATAEAQEVIYR